MDYRLLLERLPAAASAAIADLLDQLVSADEVERAQAVTCLAASRFVARWAAREPEQFLAALRAGFSSEFGAQSELPEVEPAQLDVWLRRRRNREMACMACRQTLKLDTPEQTVRALSRLADHLIGVCVQTHWGQLLQAKEVPAAAADMRPLVFALGKLGGEELNFSSDVDLVFAYCNPRREVAELAPQLHARLVRRCTKSLNNADAEGMVYRVDLRLRPFGNQGASSLSLAALDSYFESHARDWERYAWQKARCIAGERERGEDWLQELRPFIYRRYVDFGQLASLRAMKDEIDADVRSRGREQDVKRGWGGIRELEFYVQALQLIHGGAKPSLQNRSFVAALEALQVESVIEPEFARRWQAAYWELRRVENCWQAVNDEQSHVLPQDEEPRQRLLIALGHASWSEFDNELQATRSFVRAQFLELFAPLGQAELTPPLLELSRSLLDAEAGIPEIWRDLEEPLRQLRRSAVRRLGQPEARKKLVELSVQLLDACADGLGSERVVAICEAIAGRPNYVTMLLEHPAACRELVELCQRSAMIAGELQRHPALLIELCEPVSLYAPPGRAALRAHIQRQLAACDEEDFEAQLEQLRRIRHAVGLRIAAADVAGALPLMRVSDHLTELAEEIVAGALSVATAQMRQRWPQLEQLPFAVVAYGKLGGMELSYSSDLDLVFVFDDAPVGGVDLEAQVFYTRLAQKLISALSAQTGAGRCYEVDMRLRPNGNSGLLVTTLAAFERYQLETAWTWEHQALVRARPIVGAEEVIERFSALRKGVLQRPRDEQALRGEILEMRRKMLQELGPGDDSFDPKHSPGGLVDIEFFSQWLVLAHAAEYPALAIFGDVLRILEAATTAELISAEDSAALSSRYRELREQVHAEALGRVTEFDEQEDGAQRLLAEFFRGKRSD